MAWKRGLLFAAVNLAVALPFVLISSICFANPQCPDPALRDVEVGGNLIIGGVGLHKQPLKFARVRVYSSPGNKVWSGKTDKRGWFRTRTLVPGEYRLEVDGWGSTTVRLNPELDKAPAGYSKQAGTWNVLLMDEGCAGYTHIVN